jgi:hypothetical protein
MGFSSNRIYFEFNHGLSVGCVSISFTKRYPKSKMLSLNAGSKRDGTVNFFP